MLETWISWLLEFILIVEVSEKSFVDTEMTEKCDGETAVKIPPADPLGLVRQAGFEAFSGVNSRPN